MTQVESKVQAAGLWSLAVSGGIAVLNAVQANSTMLAGLPPLAQFVILTLAPPLLIIFAAFKAQHTPRPDLYNYGPALEPHLPAPPTGPELNDEDDYDPEPVRVAPPPPAPQAPAQQPLYGGGYQPTYQGGFPPPAPQPVPVYPPHQPQYAWEPPQAPSWERPVEQTRVDPASQGRHQAPPPDGRGQAWADTPIGDATAPRQPGQ